MLYRLKAGIYLPFSSEDGGFFEIFCLERGKCMTDCWLFFRFFIPGFLNNNVEDCSCKY